MKITQKDLIGDIKDFPIEVVQKMIERQVEQGNEADVEVFQRTRDTSKCSGGFHWDYTTEGLGFWMDVIMGKNFDVFFAKYPKSEKEKEEEDCWVDPKGRKMLVWDGDRLEERIVIPKTKISLSSIAEKFGLSVDEIEIDFDK